jgi:Skp family chaperone for outer membrane proteins
LEIVSKQTARLMQQNNRQFPPINFLFKQQSKKEHFKLRIMKTLRFVAAAMFFAALSIIPAAAQTGGATAPAGSGRVAIVNTLAFGDEKGGGITKYITAAKQLEAEFKPRNDELQGFVTRLSTLQKEIEAATSSAQKGAPVDAKSLEAKRDQFEDLQRQAKVKQDEANVLFERRQQAIMGPVFADIMKAMEDYRKQKGFALILDGVKMEQAQIILALDDSANITADFIKFYNARPAGTASAATPK